MLTVLIDIKYIGYIANCEFSSTRDLSFILFPSKFFLDFRKVN